MTTVFEKSAAALAALLIVAASWGPVVSVPTTSTLAIVSAPALA